MSEPRPPFEVVHHETFGTLLRCPNRKCRMVKRDREVKATDADGRHLCPLCKCPMVPMTYGEFRGPLGDGR